MSQKHGACRVSVSRAPAPALEEEEKTTAIFQTNATPTSRHPSVVFPPAIVSFSTPNNRSKKITRT